MSTLLRIIIVNSIGPLWAFILAPGLFEKYFYDAFAGEGIDVKQFLHIEVFTAFSYFWVCTMVAQIWWLWRAETNINAVEMLPRAKKTWWALAVLLMVAGVGLMAHYLWIPFPQLPMLGIMLLIILNLIDFLILFWLATATGTPGVYRSVIPGERWFS